MIFKPTAKFVLGCIIYLILRIINLFYKTRIGLYPMRLGPYITVPEIYLRRKKNESIDIWCKNNKAIPNKYLDKLISKKLNFVDYRYFSALVFFLKKCNLEKKNKKLFLNPYTRDTANIIDKYKPILTIPNSDIKKAEKILISNNIDVSKKIVCIHVRDDEYLNKMYPNQDFSYHKRRNADIKTYFKTINYLLSEDYIVFRMGKYVKQKLNIKHKNFYDFPNCKFKSELLDIYLGYKSFFSISTGSGWDQIPFSFRRPVLYTNVANISRLQLSSKKFISIFKLVKRNNKYLKLAEMLNEDVDLNFNIAKKRKKLLSNLTYIDNTEDEIVNATKEMETLIKNNFNKMNIFTNPLMKKFLEKYDFEIVRDYFNEKGHSVDIRGSISLNFLKKNEAIIFE